MPSVDATDPPDEMPKVDLRRASDLAANLSAVAQKIRSANSSGRPVRLVAVSKLQTATDILALHTRSENPHQHFGENYLQELQQKAALLPRTVRWSFIGGLQTNKCAPLAQIPNLWAVNSVDSLKKVDALEKGRREWLDTEAGRAGGEPLRVFVQVNTSGEESKSGVEPTAANSDSDTAAASDSAPLVQLCRHVQNQPSLVLQGLMTIGALARSQASAEGQENEDFVVLKRERDRVAKALGLDPNDLELSMGMSQDYEAAVSMGSAEVRVGSTIFGERPAKKDAVV